VLVTLALTCALCLRRTLIGEGHVDALRVYGPDGNTAIVTLKDSAPGGARQCKVMGHKHPVLCECAVGMCLASHPHNAKGIRKAVDHCNRMDLPHVC
jgi:hypothetical protein